MLSSLILQIKINKASKTIPLRDILDFSEHDTTNEEKEWTHYFTVLTIDREYCLFAPTRAEKEMWVHAFKTILKYKHKAEEMKKGEYAPNNENQLEMGVENEGFQGKYKYSNFTIISKHQ